MGSLFGDLFKVAGEIKSIGNEVKETLEETAQAGARAMTDLRNEAGEAVDDAKRLVHRDEAPKSPDEQG